MNFFRLFITVLATICSSFCIELQAKDIVVADSVSHTPLPNAAVFDRHGNVIGLSDNNGLLPRISKENCPVTVRYLGFSDKTAGPEFPDTIFLSENISELPEMVFESSRHRVLHILAYVREYSTMTTYGDTVFLFREKMVDYMLPSDRKVKFKGWTTPRILTSRSYYRFTDRYGLDSVSDKSRHHFSWSDWIGLAPKVSLPDGMKNSGLRQDTLRGKYSPTEIWRRDSAGIVVHIDVLADTLSRKWVPNLAGFFRHNLDYERFRIDFNYDDVKGDTLTALDLKGYSFAVESNGRGREMFRFNKVDEPFFVSTQADVYILDKEYIAVKEAKKWADRRFDTDETGIYEPMEAPALSPSILALIDRVNKIDKESVRLDFMPDRRLMGKNSGRHNYRIGNRALSLLKMATGITLYKSHKNFNDGWRKFHKELNRKQKEKNE